MVLTTYRSRGWRAWYRPTLVKTASVAAALSLSSFAASLRSLERFTPESHREIQEVARRVDGLERRLGQIAEREQLTEWVQDEMRRANPRLEADEARAYSRVLLDITDKYISVDPLFLLAVGIVESHFDVRATSRAKAKGLYQIFPATGRWLAGELGWEFTETMLYEPTKNTELAALYLDKLFARYGDPRLVLAEYNGGPVNARRLKNGSDRLAAETRNYVAKVLRVHDGLTRRLDLRPIDPGQKPVRVAALETTPTSLSD